MAIASGVRVMPRRPLTVQKIYTAPDGTKMVTCLWTSLKPGEHGIVDFPLSAVTQCTALTGGTLNEKGERQPGKGKTQLSAARKTKKSLI